MDTPIYDEYGIKYWTVENYYQALKFITKEFRIIVSEASPGQAKRIAKTETWTNDNFDRLEVMEIALRHKFAEGTSWYKKLMSTGDEEIIEWNNWGDKFWGVLDETWEGENHLGNLLMKIREEFQDDDNT